MKNILFLLLLTAVVLSTASCVSNRKFYAQRARAERLKVDSSTLSGRIASLEEEVGKLRGNVANLSTENENANQQVNMSKEEIARQTARLRQLQGLIDQQRSATETLRKKISDALTGFNSSELSVSMKNGRVYVSMQESLLFPSGSAVVNPKGQDALMKLAQVLNSNTDINVNVEGHTDSIPIHNKVFPDNWALSTARAVAISHVLIDKYMVAPQRITASGKSEYDPVGTNSTETGRALNRRTEIILEPRLDELMQLIRG